MPRENRRRRESPAREVRRPQISQAFIEEVCGQLRAATRVRRRLPGEGTLHIDRQLPFLCVYRRPKTGADAGTERLIHGEASYLVASAGGSTARLGALVEQVVETLAAEFGAFLLVEVWAGAEVQQDETVDPEAVRPMFRVFNGHPDGELDATCESLDTALRRIRVHRKNARVHVEYRRRAVPPGLKILLPASRMRALGCYILGLEVQPIYRSTQTGESFPLVMRALHRGVSRALKRAFFTFTKTRTTHRPAHFSALGPRALNKAAWEADRRLAEIANSFDFLLQVSPINTRAGWRRFRRSGFERRPVFHYRPVPVDPGEMKRRLYGINLENVDDPVISALFHAKRLELDRQLTMLLERGTRNFLLGSQQLYGPVDDHLRDCAAGILEKFPGRTHDETFSGRFTPAKFAERARQEIASYGACADENGCEVIVTDEVSGMICSQGKLLVGTSVRIPRNRVEALLQHEVGTHLLTYVNGRGQPLRQLSSGLAGYEELQEGLAVLSEYLVGQLSRARLRLLAGRVVAARYIEDGATFVETFRKLERNHDFEQRTAYRITTRIYRGGGLTKDAVYLRGLIRVVEFIRNGGDVRTLFIGKLALDQVATIRELLHRGVLSAPRLEPSYLNDPASMRRLSALADAKHLVELVNLKPRS